MSEALRRWREPSTATLQQCALRELAVPGHVAACPCVTCRGCRAALAPKPLFSSCHHCLGTTVLDGTCHNDACPINVEAREMADVAAHARLVGYGIGLAIRWAFFAAAVLLVVRSCS